MIYACDACKFLFASDQDTYDCPDCGKPKARPATQKEIEEYKKQRKEADEWYSRR